MLLQQKNRAHRALLHSREVIGGDVLLLTFQLEGNIAFTPGQYIWLVLPELLFPDEKGSRRALSIASIPNQHKTIDVAVRLGESGYKKTLAQLPINSEVEIVGPFGSAFCLPESSEIPVVLFAGGVGITPFVSLCQEYAARPRKGTLTVICSDRERGRMPFLDRLEVLSAGVSGLQVYFYENEIHAAALTNLEKLADSHVYICGPQGFVDHINTLCLNEGVSLEQLHFEHYYPTLPSTVAVRKQFLADRSQQVPSFFQSAVESSSEHIVITDVQGVIIFANKAAEKITGYTLTEMLEQTPRLWGGMMTDQFYRKLWKSKLSGVPVDKEIVNRRKNGKLYEVMAHVAPIRDQFDQVIGFIGTEEDISAVRKAEREAQQSEKRFLDLVTAIFEVYWIVELSPTMHIGYLSPAFEQIWGIDIAEMHTDPNIFLETIYSEDRQRVREAYQALIKNQVGYEVDYRVVRPDGTIVWVNDKREAVTDEDGSLVRLVGVVRDITQMKSVDQAKSEFVSLASHQLKTPIGSINWDAESLLNEDHGSLTPKQREVILEMYKTNQRMKVLVSSLLNISRLDMGTLAVKLEKADPVTVCNGIIKDLRGLASERNVEIITKFSEDVPEMNLDIGLLNIIIQNIVSNAVKYSSAAKEVSVELAVVGDCIQLQVKNEGDPIPEDEKDKIFSKLYRASNAITTDSDGNGLGLYMVKSIIELTSGRIFFTSDAEEGTIFTVRYPLHGMSVKNVPLSSIRN